MLSGPTLGKVFVGLIGVFFIYFYFKCLILCLRACCDNGEDEDLTTVRITISERRRRQRQQQQQQRQQQQPQQQPQSQSLSADCNIEEELPSRTEELLRKFKFETVTEKHKYVKNAAATRRIRNDDDDDKNDTEKEEDVGDDGSIIHAQQQQDSNPSTYLKHMLSNWGRYPSSNHDRVIPFVHPPLQHHVIMSFIKNVYLNGFKLVITMNAHCAGPI
eukprot:scaffold3086_cov75-Cylindrotheca_fusiformis.AAC.7